MTPRSGPIRVCHMEASRCKSHMEAFERTPCYNNPIESLIGSGPHPHKLSHHIRILPQEAETMIRHPTHDAGHHHHQQDDEHIRRTVLNHCFHRLHRLTRLARLWHGLSDGMPQSKRTKRLDLSQNSDECRTLHMEASKWESHSGASTWESHMEASMWQSQPEVCTLESHAEPSKRDFVILE